MLEVAAVEQIVREIFVNKTYLTQVNNRFEYQIYADYRDELSENQLKHISQSETKMEAFYDELSEYASDSIDHSRDELQSIVEKNWNEEKHGKFDSYEDIVRDFIGENVDFNFPYDHFLKEKIYVNVIVNTGDGNYDYVLNNFSSYNASDDEEIDDESSVLWLAKQQGYTKEQLTKAVKKGVYHNDSKFLKSVHTECQNVTTHMNALGFFVQMTLEEFIDFTDNKKGLVVSSGTSCGLYDPWNGAGGPLEVRLEKDVEIPSEYIEAHLDGARGYGVDDIYGMMRSFWKQTVISTK